MHLFVWRLFCFIYSLIYKCNLLIDKCWNEHAFERPLINTLSKIWWPVFEYNKSKCLFCLEMPVLLGLNINAHVMIVCHIEKKKTQLAIYRVHIGLLFCFQCLLCGEMWVYFVTGLICGKGFFIDWKVYYELIKTWHCLTVCICMGWKLVIQSWQTLGPTLAIKHCQYYKKCTTILLNCLGTCSVDMRIK